jgi:hypothetical protein
MLVWLVVVLIVFLKYWLFDSDRQPTTLVRTIGWAITCGIGSGLIVGPIAVRCTITKELRLAFPVLFITTLATCMFVSLESTLFTSMIVSVICFIVVATLIRFNLRDVWRELPAMKCPECGYDLRFVDHKQCPECGKAVDSTDHDEFGRCGARRRWGQQVCLERVYPVIISRTRMRVVTTVSVVIIVVLAGAVASKGRFTAGRFARVTFGMSSREVRLLLGEPDLVYADKGRGEVWLWTDDRPLSLMDGEYLIRMTDGVVESAWRDGF